MTRRRLFMFLTGGVAGGAAVAQVPGGPPPLPIYGPPPVPLPYPWSPLPPYQFSLPPVEQAFRLPDGTWQLLRTPTGAVLVTRNGLVLMPGMDYTVEGKVITFTQVQGSGTEDVVGTVYQ